MNEIQLRSYLDLLEKRRKQAQIRLVAYHQQLARYYNRNVRGQTF